MPTALYDPTSGVLTYQWPFTTGTSATTNGDFPFGTYSYQTTSTSTTNAWYVWPHGMQQQSITSQGYQASLQGQMGLQQGLAEFGQGLAGYQGRQPARIDLTPEQRAEYQAQQALFAQQEAERQKVWEAEQQKQREAAARAEELLVSILDATQKKDLAEKNVFYVTSRSGVRYRVMRGQAGNVYEMTAQGTIEARYCIHPAGWVPDADAMAAQKLLLETDEAAFKKIANRTPLGRVA